MRWMDISNVEPWVADLPSWVALAQLIEDLRRGAVVPFLGAGVSQAIGFPDWGQAVLQLGRLSDPKLEKLPGDPLFLADRFRQAITEEARYIAFYAQQFACDAEKRASIGRSELWKALAHLPCASWITLNYDCALEWALREHASRRVVSFDWTDRANVNRVLLGRTPSDAVHCMHLHGLVPLDGTTDSSGASGFVLTEQEYQQRYLRSDEDRSKLFVVFTSRVLLFVGCSLTDLDLMGVLREVKAKLGFRGHRHYALLAEPASDQEREERNREKLRLKYGVEAILYRNADRTFAGLPTVIRFLSRAASEEATALPLPREVAGAVVDDPEKGRWGMTPVRGGFRVSATAVREEGQWSEVNLTVEGAGRMARFHLHPTFPNKVVEQRFEAGRAVQRIFAWGAFTVGVEVLDERGTVWPLELDLADCEDLPWDFRQR